MKCRHSETWPPCSMRGSDMEELLAEWERACEFAYANPDKLLASVARAHVAGDKLANAIRVKENIPYE